MADPSWLMPGEQIVYWAKQSCRRAMMFALLTFSGAVIATVGMDLFDGDEASGHMLVSTIMAGITVGTPQFLTSYRRFELVLTSHRIFYRRGLIWRQTGEFAVADITDIEASKAGDHPFDLHLAGGESLHVHGLPDLGRLRETLEKAVGLR